MNWIKDIGKNLYKRKIIFILLFITMTISLFNCYSSIDGWKTYKVADNSLNNLKNLHEIYVVDAEFAADFSPVGKITINITDYIKEKTNYKTIAYETLNIIDKRLDGLEGKEYMELCPEVIAASYDVLDIFNFDIDTGKKDFDKDKVEAWVGYDMKDRYKIGDKITVAGSKTTLSNVEIVGVLKRNHGKFQYGGNSSNILDRSIVVLGAKNLRCQSCLIVSKDGYKDTRKNIVKAFPPGLKLKLTPCESMLTNMVNYNKEEAKNLMINCLGMFLFSLGLFIAMFVLIVNKSKRSIGIKLSCGGKRIGIYGEILAQVLVVYGASVIGALGSVLFIAQKSLPWIYIRKTDLTFDSLAQIIIIGLILIIIASIPIFIKVLRLKPSDLIKDQ